MKILIISHSYTFMFKTQSAVLAVCMVCALSCSSSARSLTEREIHVNDNRGNFDKTNIEAEIEYENALKLWRSQGIKCYTMVLRYSSFSPMSGIWAVRVSNGIVTEWIFKGERSAPRFEDFAREITAEHLFKLAKRSYQNNANSPFIIVEYDKNYGFVTLVNGKVNPGAVVRTPTDRTYIYKVLKLEPEK